MKLFIKLMISVIATVGIIFSAIADENNGVSAVEQQRNSQVGSQDSHTGKARHRVCRADVRQFCHGVKPGEGRIIACLKENKSKLSQACAQKLAKASSAKSQEDLQKEEDNAQ